MLLKAPYANCSISVQGHPYDVPATGIVDIDDAHVGELMASHGWLTPDQAAAAEQKAQTDFANKVIATMAKVASA